MTPLTREEFQKALPARMKKAVNQEIIDRVNAVLSDPDLYETYRDNLLSFSSVLQDSKYTLDQYLSAVKYVSFKLMGKTNYEAYRMTHPDRYQRMVEDGRGDKDIACYVSAYARSKLVNTIYEQTMIPTWVLNQDIYQKAINTQAELMLYARSEKVRSDAANSLLQNLKRPDVAKIELDVTAKEDRSITELRAATLALVAQQREMLQAGQVRAKDVAEAPLVIDQEDVA